MLILVVPPTNANGDMFMNYMDYTNDACMNIFTQGQKTRIISAINQYRSNLLNHNLCSGTTPAASWNCINGSCSRSRKWKWHIL